MGKKAERIRKEKKNLSGDGGGGGGESRDQNSPNAFGELKIWYCPFFNLTHCALSTKPKSGFSNIIIQGRKLSGFHPQIGTFTNCILKICMQCKKGANTYAFSLYNILQQLARAKLSQFKMVLVYTKKKILFFTFLSRKYLFLQYKNKQKWSWNSHVILAIISVSTEFLYVCSSIIIIKKMSAKVYISIVLEFFFFRFNIFSSKSR